MEPDKEQISQIAEVTRQQIKEMLNYCKIQEESLQKLPESFLSFLRERGLDERQLTVPIPRYVRIKPSYPISTEELAEKLCLKMQQIVQIEKYFWAINPRSKINHCELYEKGILYGMDYSSSFPVKCLQVRQGDRVLELCCAPGNKSMLLADSTKNIKITGVQISVNRSNVMKNLIKKYGLEQSIEIKVQDGLKFNDEEGFDKVLVDAECTHEGSLKHIYKFFKEEAINVIPHAKGEKKLSKQQEKQFKKNNTNPYTSQITKANEWTREDFQDRFLDRQKLSQLNKLQFGLLQNGFRLLKVGGTIVYSTCSFDYLQNQKIVQDFLSKEPRAQLLHAAKNLNTPIGWGNGKLEGTIRLSPSLSCCGGMFVAKLTKRPI